MERAQRDPNAPSLPSWPHYDATSDKHMVFRDPPITCLQQTDGTMRPAMMS